MASIKFTAPDKLADESNRDIVMLHSTLSGVVSQLNYIMQNIDTENMSDDVVKLIESIEV